MIKQPTPTNPGGLVAEKSGRVGGAARSWLDLCRLLAAAWSDQRPREAARLWLHAQDDTQLPISIRVRAATALEPVR